MICSTRGLAAFPSALGKADYFSSVKLITCSASRFTAWGRWGRSEKQEKCRFMKSNWRMGSGKAAFPWRPISHRSTGGQLGFCDLLTRLGGHHCLAHFWIFHCLKRNPLRPSFIQPLSTANLFPRLVLINLYIMYGHLCIDLCCMNQPFIPFAESLSTVRYSPLAQLLVAGYPGICTSASMNTCFTHTRGVALPWSHDDFESPDWLFPKIVAWMLKSPKITNEESNFWPLSQTLIFLTFCSWVRSRWCLCGLVCVSLSLACVEHIFLWAHRPPTGLLQRNFHSTPLLVLKLAHQVWLHLAIIPAVRRQRQVDLSKFKAILVFIVSPKPTKATQQDYLN